MKDKSLKRGVLLNVIIGMLIVLLLAGSLFYKIRTEQSNKIVVKVDYKNPLDKTAQYKNPFDEYQNPIDDLLIADATQ